jgi:hypothetical protein
VENSTQKAKASLPQAAVRLKLVRCDALHDEIAAGIGSGFYWLKGDLVYLITNWHNVTGINPITRASLSKTGVLPTHVILPFLLNAGIVDGRRVARWSFHKLALYKEDGSPQWLEHNALGRAVDVVAIKIGLDDEELLNRPINTYAEFVDFEPQIGDDVFVLGFPRGLDGGNNLALWKRGSIASVPTHDIDSLPKLLIDTATREGMSGAPVIVKRTGLILPRGVPDSPRSLHPDTIIGQAVAFLGVYSGRVGDDEMGVQLGIVWKSHVIDQIIDSQTFGAMPF